MAVILNRTAKQWLLMGALLLLQAAALISLVLSVPAVVEGIGSWLVWIIVLVINVLIARRYFAPQKRHLP